MKFLTLVFTLLLFVGCSSNETNTTTNTENDNNGCYWQSETSKDSYIKKCYPFAKNESLKHNIPISVILAIDVLETNYGTSSTYKETHNHFGFKIIDNPKTHNLKLKKYTDINDNDADYIESYKDFGEKFIKYHGKNTVGLKRHDYSGWITMLHNKFDKDDRQHVNNLTKIIIKHKLYELDVD